MKCGARMAMGVAGGYFLGRTKKMKLALMLGGWAAGKQLGGPGQILGQARGLLEESPELSALSDQVRGRLLEAGKGAAMAVATRQVEALTDRVGRRVEDLGDVGRVADLGDFDEASRNGEEEIEEEEEQPAPRRRRGRTAAAPRTSRTRRAPSEGRSAASRSSGNSRASGSSRSAGQRSSSSSAAKPARKASANSKSSTRTRTAKKSATSSARTPKKAAAGRRASRTARMNREGNDG